MTTEPINLPDDLDSAAEDLIRKESEKIFEQALYEMAAEQPQMPGKSPMEVLAEAIEDAEQSLENCRCMVAGEDEHYEDTGEYDSNKEDQVRSLAELVAFYDEAGPRSDPKGTYLCGDCKLRTGTNECLHVSGNISFTIGSCNQFIFGTEPLGKEFELKEKFTQQDAGYAERPKAKRFGCKACEYGGEAKAPDQDGRPSWCREWGVHIQPTACCARHDGDDMVLGEN